MKKKRRPKPAAPKRRPKPAAPKQRTGRNAAPLPTTQAYRHGFFTAIVSGPMVPFTEWFGRFLGRASYESLDDVNRATGDVMNEYNDVAAELLEKPDDFIEHVATLCGADA